MWIPIEMVGLIGEDGDKPAQVEVPYDENKPFWFFVAINDNPAATLQQSPCWSRSAGRSGHRKIIGVWLLVHNKT